jgi:ABC-type amino acid transport system permease subunit
VGAIDDGGTRMWSHAMASEQRGSELAVSERSRGPMERVIEGMASGLGNAVGFAAESGILFVVFAAIWAAFGAGLIWSQGSVDAAWDAIRGLPLVAQAVVWLLFLPVMVGLWIWETTWPLVLRLLLVVGIAGWNLLIFLPRALTARP